MRASFSVAAGLARCAVGVLLVAALTAVLLLVGRHAMSLAVAALLYLLPVGLCAWRWGLLPSVFAALGAVLAIDYFFIPPYHTLTIGELVGWQALGVFIVVAGVLIGVILASLSQARACDDEASTMADLSIALASLPTREAIAEEVVQHLRRLYPKAAVSVLLQKQGEAPQEFVSGAVTLSSAQRVRLALPIQSPGGYAGAIELQGERSRLPNPNGRLLRSCAAQTALALGCLRAKEEQ